jgi:DNA/RNA-binding domain of Phe-tRNA-synthetase-like protein
LAARPTGASKIAQAANGDEEQVIARWEDPLYRFDLTRSSYRPSFTLTAIEKKLDATAQAAILESKRLDDQEAPQRDAARAASEEEAAQAKLDKARLVNKPNFRP